MPKFQYKVPIQDALTWQIEGKATLKEVLVDEAEFTAARQHGNTFYTLEVDTTVNTIDGHFVVTFTWPATPALESETIEVLASFDITQRIAGTAKLTVPANADVSTILQDHLNHKTLELDQEHLPSDVKLLSWNLDRPSLTLETDYVEPTETSSDEQ